MLSIFPEFFNYSQLGPLILRVVLAVAVLKISWGAIFTQSEKIKKIVGGLYLLGGLFVLAGFLTQVAVLLIAILILLELMMATIKGTVLDKAMLKVVILGIAISLLFLGPGLFSIDLPL